jgi:hypothetical protein
MTAGVLRLRLFDIETRSLRFSHQALSPIQCHSGSNRLSAKAEKPSHSDRQLACQVDEKEHDKPLKIRFCPASDAKLLIYRLTVVATLIAVFVLTERIRFSLQTITKSSIVSEASSPCLFPRGQSEEASLKFFVSDGSIPRPGFIRQASRE